MPKIFGVKIIWLDYVVRSGYAVVESGLEH